MSLTWSQTPKTGFLVTRLISPPAQTTTQSLRAPLEHNLGLNAQVTGKLGEFPVGFWVIHILYAFHFGLK